MLLEIVAAPFPILPLAWDKLARSSSLPPTLAINGGSIASVTLGSGGAGDVTVQAGTISLTGGGSFSSTAFGSGTGGALSGDRVRGAVDFLT